MKRAKKAAYILCIVVAILMLAMLYMQYLPYWTVEGESASISDLVWMPKEFKDFTKHFQTFYATVLYSDFSMNDFVMLPLVIFVCFAVGPVVCLLKFGKGYAFLLPFIGGLYGAIGYAYSFIFQMGNSWVLHMVLCIVIAILSGVGAICSYLGNVKMD